MKKVLIVLFALFIFNLSIENVFASVKVLSGPMQSASCYSGSTCNKLLGDPGCEGTVAFYLQKGLNAIRIIGIVLCIGLTAFDFFWTIFQGDKDKLKAVSQKGLKRLIYMVALFFAPYIIMFILYLLDIVGTCGIE